MKGGVTATFLYAQFSRLTYLSKCTLKLIYFNNKNQPHE